MLPVSNFLSAPRRAMQALGASVPAFVNRLDQRLNQVVLNQIAQDSMTLTGGTAGRNPRAVAGNGWFLGFSRLGTSLGIALLAARDTVQDIGSQMWHGRFTSLLPGRRRPVNPHLLFPDLHLHPLFQDIHLPQTGFTGGLHGANFHGANLRGANFLGMNRTDFMREQFMREVADVYRWQAFSWRNPLAGSARNSQAHMNFFKKAPQAYSAAVRKLINQKPAERLKTLLAKFFPVRLSANDNPRNTVLGHRLFSNKSNFMNLSKELGGDEKAEKFIVETMAHEIEQHMEPHVGGNQWREHPLTNMGPGAKRLAKEGLELLKDDEHNAALIIQNAYREYRALNPNMPGRWRPEFDRSPASAAKPKAVPNVFDEQRAFLELLLKGLRPPAR